MGASCVEERLQDDSQHEYDSVNSMVRGVAGNTGNGVNCGGKVGDDAS